MSQFEKVSLFDMILCLSDAIDLVSPVVNGHHKRVAYIASSLALELGMSQEKEKDLILAGSLHDVGAFSLEERLTALNFEVGAAAFKHAERGFMILRKFAPFTEVADFVRYHHLNWEEGAGQIYNGNSVPKESHLIHLADRIDVLINNEEEILGQRDRIKATINQEAGAKFIPEFVEAFNNLASKESFWFDLDSSILSRILTNRLQGVKLKLGLSNLYALAEMFSEIIDFRSQFTATHSRGVAASGRMLAELMGLNKKKCQKLEIAGYLHDLGKLATPVKILNKPGKLSAEEYNKIKVHPFYTYRILERIEELKEIASWAAYHHEKLDGSGYPFRLSAKEIPLEARIIAVADVFTAITEDRPYRQGMEQEEALAVLNDLVDESILDKTIVATLTDNYEEINITRKKIQLREEEEYQAVNEELS
ncbi:HD domain-containing protein [Natroniella sulfidigena]|uniref:HD-GYP domain-containing protein n=1 Tax=Natroniella sulfidigena TaxID=723921 RepID=UPI00200A1615|nr:HD-GYP domain-containing protein [Natroniella sulfidigena]MCK8816842.1 HD domain-containing protein [Natroniella sulfidigena]